jgi:hypothetical protein
MLELAKDNEYPEDIKSWENDENPTDSESSDD